MATKRQEIERLVEPKLGHIVFQYFLAELVFETRNLHPKYNLEQRYAKALKAILGINIPEKPRGKDDNRVLAFAASTYKRILFKKRDEKNIERSVTRLYERYKSVPHSEQGIGLVTAEVARQMNIDNFNIGDPIPKDLDPGTVRTIKSDKERLDSKIKGHVDEFAAKQQLYFVKDHLQSVIDAEEIENIKSWIPEWLTKYGRQAGFE